MTITVVNKRLIVPELGDVYIGRPSKWGNPFSHLDQGTLASHRVVTRTRAVWSYAEWILTRPGLLRQLPELEECRLVCWCKPRSCHGDVLKFACEQGVEALQEKVSLHSVHRHPHSVE